MLSRKAICVASLAIVLAAGGGWANDPENLIEPGAVNAFGLNLQRTVIHAPEWQPIASPVPNISWTEGYLVVETTSYPGLARYWAQVQLPSGAEVHTVCFLVFDGDDAGHFDLSFRGYESAFSASPPGFFEFGTQSTGDESTPGFVNLCWTAVLPVLIRTWGDLNGDTFYHFTSYDLTATATVSAAQTLGLFGAVVEWQRTVAPAPATATFDDVPVGAFGFRHIEALAASGITAGCDAVNFCPDAPITRAQMAVFLAKALGLHWYP